MLPITPAVDESDRFKRLASTLHQLSGKYRAWAQEDLQCGRTGSAIKNAAEADRCLTDARWYQRRALQHA
jgi:hypothetical protein